MKQIALTPIMAIALAIGAPIIAAPVSVALADDIILLASDQNRDRIHMPDDGAQSYDRDRDRDRLDADRLQERDRDRLKDSDYVDRDHDRIKDRDRIHQ